MRRHGLEQHPRALGENGVLLPAVQLAGFFQELGTLVRGARGQENTCKGDPSSRPDVEPVGRVGECDRIAGERLRLAEVPPLLENEGEGGATPLEPAPVRVVAPDGFSWVDAGIGAGAALGVVLVAGGAGRAVRRHYLPAHS